MSRLRYDQAEVGFRHNGIRSDFRQGHLSTRLDPTEHDHSEDKGNGERAPKICADEGEPGQVDEGAAEQGDEEPVAARRVEAEDAAPRVAAGRVAFPNPAPATTKGKKKLPGPGGSGSQLSVVAGAGFGLNLLFTARGLRPHSLQFG